MTTTTLHAARRLRRNTIASALAVALMGAGAGLHVPPAHAQQAAPAAQPYDIPAGDLREALDALAGQGDVSVVYSPELVEGKTTKGLRGRHAPEEALRRLLEGTGLAWDAVNEATFVLKRGPVAAPAALDKAQTRGRAASGEEVTKNMPAIMVTGTRTLNMDITRTEDDAQPYVVFDRETIERSGASNLEEFFKNKLSATTSTVSLTQIAGAPMGSTSRIDLRGLGADETLILVDGRRLPGFNIQGVPSQPDVNGIPLAAIERIEVLPTTASGIYGGSATGGVINIVMRRDYDGIEAKIRYGNTFDTDAHTRRVDVSAGFNSKDGRTNVIIAASRADSAELLTRDREFVERARAHMESVNPGAIASNRIPPLGVTTNIRSVSGSNLTLKSSGQSLGSAITHIPYGYAGLESDSGAGLVEAAGQYNLDLPNTAEVGAGGVGGRLALFNSPRTESIIGTVRSEISSFLNAFVEFSRSENEGAFMHSPSLGLVMLAAEAPGNPFNEDIFVSVPITGIEQADKSSIETERLAGGLIFDLAQDWSLGLDYTWSRTSSSSFLPGFTDGASASAAIASGAINIFRDMQQYPVSFEQFVLPEPLFTPSVTTLENAAIRAGGPLELSLPGGQVQLSMLIEHRKETFGDQFQVFPQSQNFILRNLYPEQQQKVDSMYFETVFPVFSKKNNIKWIDALDIQLAARHDRYTSIGSSVVQLDEDNMPIQPVAKSVNRISSTNPSVALRYKPIPGLMLRTNYGTGFLPPAVNQLTPRPPRTLAFNLTDPRRGGEQLGPVTLMSGGNPDLRPEKSESLAIGLVIYPEVIKGLRFSVDWTQIRKTDNISQVFRFSQDDLNNEEFVPGLVTRSDVPPGDPFDVGPIVGLSSGLFNLSRMEVQAYDFALDYYLNMDSMGDLDIALNATMLDSLKVKLSEVSPTLEYAGVGRATVSASETGGLQWRANASITWTNDRWVLGWAASYFDSYFLNIDHVFVVNQGSAKVKSQIYHNLFASYDLLPYESQDGLISGLELEIGINNVFNRKPPVDVVGLAGSSPGYSYYGDPRLANYYIALKANFGNR